MKYETFVRTGLKVSRVGFGGIPIQRVDMEDSKRIVHACLMQGVNFFDTARGYGDSEEKLGRALLGKRHQAILSSKSLSRDATGLRRDLEVCLKELQTDYVDLYQLHNVATPEAWETVSGPGGALEELLRARDTGLIRFVGVSSHSNDLLLKMQNTELFDSIQFPYNAVEKQFLPSLERAGELNLGTIAMKPLAGGSFSRPDLAIRYALEAPIAVIIPGVDSLEQVKANATAADAPALTAVEHELILQEARALGQDFCRRCDYCQPCPSGVPISTIFILEGYVRRYGLSDWAETRYAALPVDAADCIECGLCESRCPYSLSIRDKLRRAHEVLAE